MVFLTWLLLVWVIALSFLVWRLFMAQSDIVAEIAAAKAEIATKVQSLSAALAAALAASSTVTPELQAAADDLKAFADGLAVPPSPPAPPAP